MYYMSDIHRNFPVFYPVLWEASVPECCRDKDSEVSCLPRALVHWEEIRTLLSITEIIFQILAEATGIVEDAINTGLQ